MSWLNISFYSTALAMPVTMQVLLPQRLTSDKTRGTTQPGPYKTLYLLHGKRQDCTSWLRRTTLEDKTAGLPLAVVMPSVHLSWYADTKYGCRYFSYITQELPRLCEMMFPLSPKREDRFIAGLSMGGYGAFKATLAAPETFGGAMSMSGVLDLEEVYDRPEHSSIEEAIGTREEMRDSVCDLFALAGRYPKDLNTPFYLCCGTEDNHIGSAHRFWKYAQSQGLQVHYEEGPGAHNWAYWDSCIPALLRYAMGES